MAGPTMTASPFITSLGSFSDFTTMFGDPMFMFAHSLVSYVIFTDYLTGKIDNTIMIYLGDVMVLIVQLCAAAYMVYKVTDAVISFTDGLAKIYRRQNIVANYMGQYEFTFAILFFGTPMVLAMAAIYGAMQIWNTIAEREEAVATEGFLGAVVSMNDLFKFGCLGLVVSVVTWYSAHSIGEVVDELLGWFDQMDDKAGNEGTNKQTGSTDIAGTSIINELQYHGVTVIYSWAVFTWLMVGANLFAMNFFQFKRLEDCNLDDVDESYYEPVRPLIASEVDLPSCKTAVKGIFKIADLDGSQVISRCENAKFLYGMGNSSEYALLYSEVKTLPMLWQSICYKNFPDYGAPTSHSD